MLRYLSGRLVLSLLMLLGVVFATFFLHHALPGDPAAAVLGKQYTPEKADSIRENLGLNDPILEQGIRYSQEVLAGDFGRSHVSSQEVRKELPRAFFATLELSAMALAIALILGVLLGIFSALKPGSWKDLLGLVVALAGVSLPIFWLGFLALQLFGEQGYLSSLFGIDGLPLGGRFASELYALGKWSQETPGTTGLFLYDTLFIAQDPEVFLHVLKHLILPALVLASVPTAIITRITRSALSETLRQDYIRTARAKGLNARTIIFKHALRNASIPIVTSVGSQFGYLLGGAVLTETIFQWPGMGSYTLSAILNLDIKPLQACILVVALGFIVINLIVDMSYVALDPRVRRLTTKS